MEDFEVLHDHDTDKPSSLQDVLEQIGSEAKETPENSDKHEFKNPPENSDGKESEEKGNENLVPIVTSSDISEHKVKTPQGLKRPKTMIHNEPDILTDTTIKTNEDFEIHS